MERRDYDLIARVIKYRFCKPALTAELCDCFIVELKQDNANFDPDKFKKACGL